MGRGVIDHCPSLPLTAARYRDSHAKSLWAKKPEKSLKSLRIECGIPEVSGVSLANCLASDGKAFSGRAEMELMMDAWDENSREVERRGLVSSATRTPQ
jgi:hypothetical protein